MAKYRKKPVVIEAEQFLPGTSWPIGVYANASCCILSDCAMGVPHVHTIHDGGRAGIRVVHGDWIIPEPGGERHYPCKSDIFEATYEPVEP